MWTRARSDYYPASGVWIPGVDAPDPAGGNAVLARGCFPGDEGSSTLGTRYRWRDVVWLCVANVRILGREASSEGPSFHIVGCLLDGARRDSFEELLSQRIMKSSKSYKRSI